MLYYYNRDGRFQKESSKEYKTEKGAVDKLEKEGVGAVFDETGKLVTELKKEPEGADSGQEPEGTDNGQEPEGADDEQEFDVYTTCDSLKIRSGAGQHYKKVGAIIENAADKKPHTIVEVKNGWGKLKSGAGWISIAFTKKVGQ